MSKPKCIDCGEREQAGRQLCKGCAQRWRRAGRELPPGPRNRQTWEQVVADVTRGRTDDECWPWTKSVNSQGYAQGGSQFGTQSAAVAMYIHFTGEDLADKRLVRACHEADLTCVCGPDCPHRRCVNPAHGRVIQPEDRSIVRLADKPRCIDCGVRPVLGRGLCKRCRKARVDNGVALPRGERNRQTWEEILADVMGGRSDDECWPWTKSLTEQGYGVSGNTKLGSRLAHRAVFEYLTGQDPKGFELDHLCHNNDPNCFGGPECEHRKCCNPNHLQLTSGSINLARRKPESMASGAAKRVAQKTHCPHGHELTEENIYWFRGKRLCRKCRTISARKTAEKKKAREAAEEAAARAS